MAGERLGMLLFFFFFSSSGLCFLLSSIMAIVVSSRFVVRVVSNARWPSEVGFSTLVCGFGKKKKKI